MEDGHDFLSRLYRQQTPSPSTSTHSRYSPLLYLFFSLSSLYVTEEICLSDAGEGIKTTAKKGLGLFLYYPSTTSVWCEPFQAWRRTGAEESLRHHLDFSSGIQIPGAYYTLHRIPERGAGTQINNAEFEISKYLVRFSQDRGVKGGGTSGRHTLKILSKQIL
jgi:hypothetical protein